MTGRDVPDGDMSDTPGPQRNGLPGIPEEALDRLLASSPPAGGEPPVLQPVGELLTALTAGPDQAELRGHGQALDAFRQHGPASTAGARRPRGRATHRLRRAGPLLPLRARLAATGAAATLALGGLTTAAYARVLPVPAQRLAHDVIGAPSPVPGPSGRPVAPSGPDGNGPAGSRPGHPPPPGSRAGRHPARPAVPPGAGTGATATAAGEHGKPTSLPTPGEHVKPSAHPSGKPPTHPGQASTHPSQGAAAASPPPG